MFYSKSTGGFYDAAIHGNAMPSDAVEITAEQHVSLLEAQSAGKAIRAGEDGMPVAVDPSPLTGNALYLSEIANLEASVTQRRLREAALGTDGGWLANLDKQITDLRKMILR